MINDKIDMNTLTLSKDTSKLQNTDTPKLATDTNYNESWYYSIFNF